MGTNIRYNTTHIISSATCSKSATAGATAPDEACRSMRRSSSTDSHRPPQSSSNTLRMCVMDRLVMHDSALCARPDTTPAAAAALSSQRERCRLRRCGCEFRRVVIACTVAGWSCTTPSRSKPGFCRHPNCSIAEVQREAWCGHT